MLVIATEDEKKVMNDRPDLWAMRTVDLIKKVIELEAALKGRTVSCVCGGRAATYREIAYLLHDDDWKTRFWLIERAEAIEGEGA